MDIENGGVVVNKALARRGKVLMRDELSVTSVLGVNRPAVVKVRWTLAMFAGLGEVAS